MAQEKRKRELGWDLWRFIGTFLIFIGHNGLAIQLSQYYKPNEMQASSILGVLVAPADVSQTLLYTAVPVFLFISGYFLLSRPSNPKKDWVKAKSDFWKYIRHYWKWLTIPGVIILLLAFMKGPNAVAPMFLQKSMNWWDLLMGLLGNYVNMSLLDGGATTMVALNWFFVIMAWLMLLAPILKYFVQSKNIHMLRTVALVLLIFSYIIPTINYVFKYVVTFDKNVVTQFFANFHPFFTDPSIGFNFINFAIPMFLFGGIFAVDTELKEKIKSWSWPKAISIVLILFAIQVVIQYFSDIVPSKNGANLSYYLHAGWIPMAIGWVILAVKWNDIISENSHLGKFILNWASDSLGVMTLGWFAGPYVLSAVVIPIFDMMIKNIWNPNNPIIFTSVLMLFYLVYWVITYIIVHFVKKIPYIRRLFMFPGAKVNKKNA